MIPVLINGTPIYKLCFARKPYSYTKRKNVPFTKVADAIKRLWYPRATDGVINMPSADDVLKAIRSTRQGGPLFETTALIYITDARRGDPPVATATVRQMATDKHSRETARMQALQVLLRDTPGDAPFGRKERAAIWNAYLNRPRPKGTKPPTTTPPIAAGGTQPALVTPVVVPPRDAGRPAGITARPPDTPVVVSKVVSIRRGRPWYAESADLVH